MKNLSNLILSFLLCFSVSTFGQQKITGKVISAYEDEALVGVTIVIKGTTTGTITDINGNFTITASSSDTLVVNLVGYETASESVGNRSVVDIALIPNIKTLSDVVVIGYGTVRKVDLTGAVSSVKANDLPMTATTSIDNMLQGRAAGLNLTSRSAQPGGGLDINIRGEISPKGNNSPLYVIDGVPITNNNSSDPSLKDDDLGYYGGVDRSPLNTINPSDIESIDILKDASASAIYGSAAANGVILITTKKGKQGKITAEYRGSYTIQTPKKYFELLNATEFRQQHNRFMYEKFLYNNGAAPYGTENPDSLTGYTAPFTQQEIDEAGEGTDWLDVIMRNGKIQEHNISVTGGNENSTIYTSFNYYNNKAILENSDFVRYSGRINLDQKLGKRVNTSLKLNFSQINSKNAATGSNNGGIEKYNMLQAAYSFAPDMPIYDEFGKFTYSYDRQLSNPASFLIIDDNLRSNRFTITPKIDIQILDGLNFIVTGGMDRQASFRSYYLPVSAQRSNISNGMAQLSNNKIDNYSGEGYLNYKKDFTNSNLVLVLGGGYYNYLNDGYGLVGRGFFTDAFGYNNVGISSELMQNSISSFRNERTKISQFFRINYSLMDKYLVTVVGRRDAVSNFAPNRKYGFFPGVSAAWKINNEEFMSGIDILSELKLRAGYGTAGNDNAVNWMRLYQTVGTYSIGSNAYPSVILAQEENRDLSWETDITLDFGLDFGFYSNRITGSFDYFNKTAKDLLDYSKLPSNNAIARVLKNVGTTRSVGYELMLRSNNISKSDFKWSTELSVSTYKAYWVDRNPEVTLPSYVGEHDEIHAIYGWETDGVIQTESDRPAYMPDAYLGNVKYVDQNGDGVLDIKDVKQIGNTDPKWSLGLANTVFYKGFDLNFYFYGYLKRSALYGYRPAGVNSTTASTDYSISVDPPNNMVTSVKDVWTHDNADGIYPGVAPDMYDGDNPAVNTHLPTNNQFYTVNNDFYLRDASFIRLKNITLGYTLPSDNILNFVHSLRVFVDLQNVAVFTKYEGFDPEYTDINPYPQAFSTTVGVNITF